MFPILAGAKSSNDEKFLDIKNFPDKPVIKPLNFIKYKPVIDTVSASLLVVIVGSLFIFANFINE